MKNAHPICKHIDKAPRAEGRDIEFTTEPE